MNNLKCLIEGGAPEKGFPKTEVSVFDYVFRQLNVETFYADYWEKKPLYIQSDDPNYYAQVLDELNLDEILCSRFLHEGDIRIFKNESQVPFNLYSKPLPGLYGNRKVLQAAKAINLYQDGHTLIFQNVNKYSQKFGALVRSFEREAQFSARANIYVTPPNSCGFGKHWDHMCSIIMQLDGEKEWHIYEQEVTYPSPMLGPDQGKEKSSKLLFTQILKPGDLLYVPRGFAHAPKTNATHSVHANIAFKPIYASDLLEVFVRDAIATEPLLRQGLHPLGAKIDCDISALVINLLRDYDWQSALQLTRQETLQDRSPMYQQWWRQEQLMTKLSPETLFAFNPSMEWSFTVNDRNIKIITNGKKFSVDKRNEEVLNYIKNRSYEFYYRDLPLVGDDNQFNIVSELVRSGVIFIKTGKNNNDFLSN